MKKLRIALLAGLSRGISVMFGCLLLFHSPDGINLAIETAQIIAVRPAAGVREHVAPGTHTIIYVAGKVFGVTETPEVVERMIKACAQEDKQ